MKTLTKKIERLRKIEQKAGERAIKTRNYMAMLESSSFNELQSRWENLYEELKFTSEFIQDCKDRGMVTKYSFMDLLA